MPWRSLSLFSGVTSAVESQLSFLEFHWCCISAYAVQFTECLYLAPPIRPLWELRSYSPVTRVFDRKPRPHHRRVSRLWRLGRHRFLSRRRSATANSRPKLLLLQCSFITALNTLSRP